MLGKGKAAEAAEQTGAVPWRAGVRVYLFVLFSIVACVPVTLLGIVQGRRSAQDAVAGTDRQTLATATAFSLQVSLALTDYLRATESFAAQIAAHGGLEGRDIAAALEAHNIPHPEFVGSYVARANGFSFAHYSRGIGPFVASHDYTSRDYYRELLRTGRPAISRVQVGQVTGSPDIQIVAPIRDASGTMIGFVCTSVDLQRLSEKALVFARGLTNGRLLVLDRERRVIADSTRERASLVDVSPVELYASTDVASTRVGTDDNDEPVRSSVVPIAEPSHDWSVIASVPTRIVEDQTRTAQMVVLLVALGAIGFALTLAALLAVRLAAPLQSLAHSATLIAAGDTVQLPEVPARAPRELAQVSEAVRHMVVALREYARGLQVLVDGRTRELRNANVVLASTLEKLEREQTILAQDLAQARHFQERLLPTLGGALGVSVATHFRPLEQVGGDIYDLVQLGPTWHRVFLADATGHGVQAAMRTIVIKFEYDRIKRDVHDVDELLTRLNRRLLELFPEGELHCAAVCADLRQVSRDAELTIASAGGPPLLVVAPDELREVYVPGPLLGVTELTFDPPTRVPVTRGASLVFASDGLFEQMNRARRRFDSALDPVALRERRGAEQCRDAIVEQFEVFLAGDAPSDDVTLVVVQVPGADADELAASLTR